MSSPGVDVRVSQRLLSHLTTNIASGPFVPQQRPPVPPPPAGAAHTVPMPNMFQTPPKQHSAPAYGGPAVSPPISSRPAVGLHSPPIVSLERKITPPPRPNSNPDPSRSSCHFTVKITTKTSYSEDEAEKVAAAASEADRPIKPEPIRLNPNDPVWRPF